MTEFTPEQRAALSFAALVQAICAKMIRLRKANLSFNPYRVGMLEENKWRAARYGVKGKLIDWGKKKEIPFVDLAEQLIEFVDEVLDELGSRAEVEHILNIVKHGTSADRQLEVFERTGGDLKAVVDSILAETMQGVL